MRTQKTLTALLLVLSSFVASAAENWIVPDPSNPSVALFLKWHESLLKKDYVLYQKVSSWDENIIRPVDVPPGSTRKEVSESIRKQIFDEKIKNVPPTVKITEPQEVHNGNIEFYAAGCKDNQRLLTRILVVKTDGNWSVISGGSYSPPWNATAKICPV
jgi:hypothetical protein